MWEEIPIGQFASRPIPGAIKLANGSGTTKAGDPYRRIFLRDGVLMPGQSTTRKLVFSRPANSPPVSYTLRLLSGQGQP
jgi:hypothetical protein